jgi:hypothetical protein
MPRYDKPDISSDEREADEAERRLAWAEFYESLDRDDEGYLVATVTAAPDLPF